MLSLLGIVVFLVLRVEAQGRTGVCDHACDGSLGKMCQINSLMQIVVEVGSGGQQKFFPFCLYVDEFSELILNGTYDWVRKGNLTERAKDSYIQIHLPSPTPGRYISSARRGIIEYNQQDDRFFYAYRFTAIISLTLGSYSRWFADPFANENSTIMFEDNCSGDVYSGTCWEDYQMRCIGGSTCGLESGSTYESTLAYNYNKFQPTVMKDFKLFLVFDGSDSKGSAFKSNSYLPSRFRWFSFGKYWYTVYNFFRV